MFFLENGCWCNKLTTLTRFNYIYIEFIALQAMAYRGQLNKTSSNSILSLNSLLSSSRQTLKSKVSRSFTEKDQIESIRKVAGFMLEQVQPSQNKKSNSIFGSSFKKSIDIELKQPNKATLNQQRESIKNIHLKKQVQLLRMENSRTSSIGGENRLIKQKDSSSYIDILSINQPQIKNPKQSNPKCLATKIKAKEEQMMKHVQHGQKGLNYTKHKDCLVNMTSTKLIDQKWKHQEKAKPTKVATEEERRKIFQGVHNRAQQMKQKKQAKVKKILKQKKQSQLVGITFTPRLSSSRNLRNSISKGFLQRLKDNQQNKQRRLAQILTSQLKKTTFKPATNTHKNSNSKSKIDSFRSQDLPYFNVQQVPSLDFEQVLSRLSSSKNSARSLTKSSIHHESNITAKTNDFNFLFQ